MGELAGFTVGVTADRRRDELRRAAGAARRPGRARPGAADRAARRRQPAARGHPALSGASRRTSWWPTPASACAAGWRRPRAGGWPSRCAAVLSRAYVVGPRPQGAGGDPRGRPARRTGRRDVESYDEVVEHLHRRGVAGRVGRACSCTASRQPECTAALEAAGATGDRGAGLPLGAADRPGAAAPADRPDRRPAGRRGHVHLGAGRRGAAAGRPGRAPRRCSPRCARTCWPPASARSPPRRCAARRAGGRAGPGPARRAGPDDRRRAAPPGGHRSGGGHRSPCAGTPRWSTANCGRSRRPRWRCCGRWPRRPGGCCPGPPCCAPCPGAPTSTRWRWRWPGCAPGWARPAWCRPSVKRGYRLRVD